MTIWVSIGNSDDKLKQGLWAEFVSNVDTVIRTSAEKIWAETHSVPNAPYQNAHWCFEVNVAAKPLIREKLAMLASYYSQDSIAWLEGESEFITPSEGS